jgi:hypothetical protein
VPTIGSEKPEVAEYQDEYMFIKLESIYTNNTFIFEEAL